MYGSQILPEAHPTAHPTFMLFFFRVCDPPALASWATTIVALSHPARCKVSLCWNLKKTLLMKLLSFSTRKLYQIFSVKAFMGLNDLFFFLSKVRFGIGNELWCVCVCVCIRKRDSVSLVTQAVITTTVHAVLWMEPRPLCIYAGKQSPPWRQGSHFQVSSLSYFLTYKGKNPTLSWKVSDLIALF